MMTIDPQTTPTPDFHQFMIAAIAPRPIAFVSTIDSDGKTNLARFSFFNAFSSKPPIVVFSANRRVQDGTTKDTLSNIEDTMECVINVVTYNISRQAAIASVNFPREVSEFKKAGFTPLKSELVKPFRVEESPVQMECRVERILPLGTEGGAGHLIVCHVLKMHVDEKILDVEKKRIDPNKIDLVGRLGRFWYSRASGNALFEIVQPEKPIVIGFDALPENIRKSTILTGNSMSQIAALTELPDKEAILSIKNDSQVQKILFTPDKLRGLHLLAQEAFQKGDKERGIKLALLGELI
jgi:flavin reductase (DIM6/NTAB) family NADH-FMN oxidoreductase RutF